MYNKQARFWKSVVCCNRSTLLSPTRVMSRTNSYNHRLLSMGRLGCKAVLLSRDLVPHRLSYQPLRRQKTCSRDLLLFTSCTQTAEAKREPPDILRGASVLLLLLLLLFKDSPLPSMIQCSDRYALRCDEGELIGCYKIVDADASLSTNESAVGS